MMERLKTACISAHTVVVGGQEFQTAIGQSGTFEPPRGFYQNNPVGLPGRLLSIILTAAQIAPQERKSARFWRFGMQLRRRERAKPDVQPDSSLSVPGSPTLGPSIANVKCSILIFEAAF